MEAVVTVKMTPHELDLIRTAIDVRRKQQAERVLDNALDAKTRQASRQEAAELALILEKLR